MEIEFLNSGKFPQTLIDDIKKCWGSHPLSKLIDRGLGDTVNLSIVNGNGFSVNSSHYPLVVLKIDPEYYLVNDIGFCPIILHEFSHLIDKLNNSFMGNFSIKEFDNLVLDLHDSNFHVWKSFIAFWDAFIDGRLLRRNIRVHEFEERLEDLIGTYKFKLHPDEAMIRIYQIPLKEVWDSENITAINLFQLCEKYPYIKDN